MGTALGSILRQRQTARWKQTRTERGKERERERKGQHAGENNVPLMQSEALAEGPAPICISPQSARYTFFMNAERELATDCRRKLLLLLSRRGVEAGEGGERGGEERGRDLSGGTGRETRER